MTHFDHPWFKPLWRRVCVVGVCFLWAGVEALGTASYLWAGIFAALGAYAGFNLLYRYTPPAEETGGRR